MENPIIQVTTGQIGFLTLALSALWSLSFLWLKSRLVESIKHEYDKKLENYRLDHLRRQKAEIAARFLSKWIKYRGQEEKILNKNELIDYYEDLNRLSFEICLWLPDEKLLTDIYSRLQNKEGAKTAEVLLGEIRKLILDNPEDEFDEANIVTWPHPEKMKSLFNI